MKTFIAILRGINVSGQRRVPEGYHVHQKWIYVHDPDGYGRTKINNLFFEKQLKITATTRNWKTCLKLMEMAKSIEGS